MKTAGRIILFIIFILIAGFGITRLRFDTNLTTVLPPKIAQVEAVKSFNQYFKDDQHVVVWLHTEDEKVYADDAAELAQFLEDHLRCEVIHSPDFDQEDGIYAREVAKVWTLSNPSVIREFKESLDNPNALREKLYALKEKVRSSFESGKAIRQSYDPFGFLEHPSLQKLAETEYSFESDDGQSRFLLVKNLTQHTSNSYTNDTEWLTQLRTTLQEWNRDYDDLFRFGLTGGPVYNSEVGTGMQQDLLGTLSMTLGLVGLLFLILQRSFFQLIMLTLVVVVTFLLTLGIAGWIIPSLSVLSMGFAAILLGLVIDYAVVILRESSHFDNNRQSIRKGLGSSIIWAAVTTSLVFSILMLSSFPGVKQLGLLILIGLASGAYVMLYAVPWYIQFMKPKAGLQITRAARYSKKILFLPAMLLLVGGGVFFLKGTPTFSFALSSLQPKSGEATIIQSELAQRFSSWSDLRTVVFAHADSPETLREKLQKAEKAALDLQEAGLLTDVLLPSELIPNPDDYDANLAAMRSILSRWDDISSIALEVGFTEEALKYDHAIAKAFSTLPETYAEFKQLPTDHSITKGMIATDGDNIYFRGNVTLAQPLTPETFAKMTALNSDNVIMTGWGTLSAALEPVVRSDFQNVFLPAALIILIALGVVFRNWKEAALVLIVLITSLISVNACMVFLGIQWNFLNIIGFPLILGVGIDYSIHLIFALRRQGSLQKSIWHGVGIAITFCGISSVIGFGSLALAQNEVLRSLGSVCAIGVFITMLLTLLVIPPVWRNWCNSN